ncbi:hypothetical protein MRB53_040373 [Persea americana]|nr:hypothetical protein MRB53_040373 [Persea americana]
MLSKHTVGPHSHVIDASVHSPTGLDLYILLAVPLHSPSSRTHLSVCQRYKIMASDGLKRKRSPSPDRALHHPRMSSFSHANNNHTASFALDIKQDPLPYSSRHSSHSPVARLHIRIPTA